LEHANQIFEGVKPTVQSSLENNGIVENQIWKSISRF